MLVTLILGAGLVVASAAVGQAVLVLSGYDSWRWWAPALGFGLLMAIAAQIVWLPARARAVALLLLGVTVAALLLPRVRRDLRTALPEGLALAALVGLAAALPYLAYGRWGILGVNVQNDAAQHLSEAFWLRTHAGFVPVAALGGTLEAAQYPVGPHALAATLALRGIGDEKGFAAVQMVVPVLAGLAALGLLRTGPRLGRLLVAALVGTSYLFVSYYAQGAFKETMEAMFLLAVVAALADWARRPSGGRVSSGVPIGLLAGSTVYVLSYGGLAWPLGAAGAFVAVEAVRRRREGRELRRAYLPALGGGILGLLLVVGPEFQRMRTFSLSFFAHEPPKGVGNLPGPLSPAKALGVWFSGDFRRPSEAVWLAYPLLALALLALVAGLVWWWRRRELAVPVGLAVAFLIWVHISQTRNIYNGAKGLPVLAPLLALCLGAPLLAAWSAHATEPRRRRLLLAVRAVGVLLLVTGAASSFSVLRDAFVGLGPQSTQLQRLAVQTRGQDTLFLGNDHFAEWMLRRSRPHFNGVLYNPFPLGFRADKPAGRGEPFDVDNVSRRELDAMRFLITPRTSYQSAVPRNFTEVDRTPSFVLYRRTGPTPRRAVLEAPGRPAALLRCDTPEGRRLLGENTRAAVVPPAVVVPQRAWSALPLTPGADGAMRVRLPPGRWDVSLQYANATGLELEGPGLRTSLPAYMGRGGPFWAAGTVRSDGGEITLRAHAPHRSIVGRLLGTPRPFRVQFFPGRGNVNRVAFTRAGARPELVPIRRACGRWVDFLS